MLLCERRREGRKKEDREGVDQVLFIIRTQRVAHHLITTYSAGRTEKHQQCL